MQFPESQQVIKHWVINIFKIWGSCRSCGSCCRTNDFSDLLPTRRDDLIQMTKLFVGVPNDSFLFLRIANTLWSFKMLNFMNGPAYNRLVRSPCIDVNGQRLQAICGDLPS